VLTGADPFDRLAEVLGEGIARSAGATREEVTA
jgi:hypothetical protein